MPKDFFFYDFIFFELRISLLYRQETEKEGNDTFSKLEQWARHFFVMIVIFKLKKC